MSANFLLCENSFSTYHRLFEHFWLPFLLKWKGDHLVSMTPSSDNGHQTHRSRLKSKLFYYIWLVNTFGVVGILGAGSSGYVVIRSIERPGTISLATLTLSIIILLVTLLISGLSLAFAQADKDLAYSYNANNQLANYLGNLNSSLDIT